MATEIEWIGDEARFTALASEWDRLAGGSPFDLHCWYAAWWKAFGAASDLATVALWRDSELVGVFPLVRTDGKLRAMANTHSPSYRPLARDADALAELIAAASAAGAFELCAVSQQPECIEPLTAGARANGLLPVVDFDYTSPTVDTSGDFAAWRAASKKRWGAPLERFRRKMGRDHQAEITIMESPGDLERELADGYRVEASGWKGEQGTAIISQPQTEAFYTAVARAFAARGELRFSHIRLDGESAAFDFTLLHCGRLYLLKTGFDERFRKLAPGLVMRLSIIERCFELGLDSHELLGDESEWKSKFATGSRPHAKLRTYRRSPAGFAHYVYRHSVRPRLRDAYRRMRP